MTSVTRTDLAAALLAQDKIDEAVAVAEKVWEARERAAMPPAHSGVAAYTLVRGLWAFGGNDARRRAYSLASTALGTLREAHHPAGEIEQWLKAHANP